MKATPTPLTRSHPNSKDREQVRVLAGLGSSVEFICSELKLDPEELTTHYAKDLELGPQEANARVAQTFFDLATSGDYPQMTISWLKMRANWSDSASNLPSSDEEKEAELTSLQDRLRNLLQNRPDVVQKLS